MNNINCIDNIQGTAVVFLYDKTFWLVCKYVYMHVYMNIYVHECIYLVKILCHEYEM